MTLLAPSRALCERLLQPAGWRGLVWILPVVVGLHLVAAAVTIRHSNQDLTASDQGAELWLAATARNDLLPQRTDGVRHPLWSWFARHLHTDNLQEFFVRGKWLNTLMCVGFLCGLGVAASRRLDPLALANLLLLASLGILLVRGTYFQPEPLYYLLSFLAMVVGWRLLGGGSLGRWALFGAICGLAYLAKPSLAPFLLVYGAAWALRVFLAWKQGESPFLRTLPGAALAGVVFAVILLPLALFSAAHFGKPLFNYTKYWMWMDDFATEAWPFQDRYPGGKQLAQLPAAETPSLGWYFQRHTLGDAVNRAVAGSASVTARFFFPEPKLRAAAFFWRKDGKKWEQPLAHRGIYLMTLGLLVVGLASGARAALADRFTQGATWPRLAFVVLLAAVYTALYGWYWPIGKGDRFMGSLWIPAVFLTIWLAHTLRGLRADRPANLAYLGVHGAILLSLILQAIGMFWRFQHGTFLVTRN